MLLGVGCISWDLYAEFEACTNDDGSIPWFGRGFICAVVSDGIIVRSLQSRGGDWMAW
jgi:hypothetical protein